jgi:sugar/nucleoside kinase (ribokinase family)
MSVLIAGSVALDCLKTPFGKRKNILGGSAVHAGVAASFYSPVALVGVVGRDFPKKYIDFLESRHIDLSGLKISHGKTFHWDGFYEYDMREAHTIRTELNVLSGFNPVLSEDHKKCKFVFLANLDPDIQLKILSQMKSPTLKVADTMNYWIKNKPASLKKVIKNVDVMLLNDTEARQFMREPNLIRASYGILGLGVKYVIIKKGEHGALLFSKNIHFSAPSYPQNNLIDPTGAGDSFAGGFVGYLAKSGSVNESNIKKAIIVGSVMASFNVEDFSLDRMRTLGHKKIISRFNQFRKFSKFGKLPVNCFFKK